MEVPLDYWLAVKEWLEWTLALLCDEVICVSNNGELDALQAHGKETWSVKL